MPVAKRCDLLALAAILMVADWSDIDHTRVQAQRVRLVGLPFGELYETITRGKGTMPGYGKQISVEDRWAIAHYLKALQQHFN